MMLIAHGPHAARLQYQARIAGDILVDPPSCEGSENVAMSYDENIVRFSDRPFGLADGVRVEALAEVDDQGVEAVGDLLG